MGAERIIRITYVQGKLLNSHSLKFDREFKLVVILYR